jgi:peptidoglycan/LPS O-acetylase OafA/YrhL
MQYMNEYYLQIKVAFVMSYAVMIWTSCMLFIGLFKKFAAKPSTFTQKLANHSYWLYLVHLPIVVWLQVAVAELNWPILLKLCVIFVITLVVAWLAMPGKVILRKLSMKRMQST